MLTIVQLVLKKFIELAEEKVKTAQAKADEVQSTLETTASRSTIWKLPRHQSLSYYLLYPANSPETVQIVLSSHHG
jgi:translation initiation factor 3 subunit A